MSANLLVEGAVILLATGAIWKGSDWLEAASERLAAHYGLPEVVQGAIIVAVGSSFPELATVVVAALGGSMPLGVGAIVGSAIFNVLVIPAAAGIATTDHIESNRTLVYKEAQFYMLAVSVLLITFALAVIYYPGEAALSGAVTRPLALIPLALYGLYVFIQYQDTADHEVEGNEAGDVAVGRQWLYLLAGLAVILVAVESLVHSVGVIGQAIGADEFLLGVTILAAATSLPDTLVSVRAARDNRGVASLANVLGSNTFDLLVAIPMGVLIAGVWTVDFAMAVPMFGVLTLATILLFTALRTDLELSGAESYALLGAYVLFVAWVVAETAGLGAGLLPSE
ncbi:sodium:calcium antiporter [Haloarcula nitratireducens]|uniref:Sodium:calcium antiporter n=1 Tax=Haloarcula nitratireducens TaxID=2487749 RepID=A0AAW4PB18_9EURY|nr:sodium:calcium antiporter [Halomicroarcula nitratireducens]MBX0294948.1 sodium:calcium antiporter [Halomicroarcula nitratireducens]